MAAPRLSPAVLSATLDAIRQHGTETAAAHALGLSRSTFQSRHREAKLAMQHGTLSAPVDPMIREPLASFEEAAAQWDRTIGRMRDRYKGPAKPRTLKNGWKKHLVIPDVHSPFHHREFLAKMFAREQDAHKAWFMGDIDDAYALSTFLHYERVPFNSGWEETSLIVEKASEVWPEVEIIEGNHDARLEKRLRERLSEDQVEAVKYMTGGILSPVAALARRFPNVKVSHHQTPEGPAAGWFATVGDCWMGHPEKFSRTPGAALRSVEEWIADNEDALGLNNYRLIVLAHTHQYSLFPWRSGKLLHECGCLAQTQGYMVSPKIGGRPQRRGYTTFWQRNERTDLNSVKFHWLDAEDDDEAA